jgi:hypothetical protein
LVPPQTITQDPGNEIADLHALYLIARTTMKHLSSLLDQLALDGVQVLEAADWLGKLMSFGQDQRPTLCTRRPAGWICGFARPEPTIRPKPTIPIIGYLFRHQLTPNPIDAILAYFGYP